MIPVEINIEDQAWNSVQGFGVWSKGMEDLFFEAVRRKFKRGEFSVSLLLTNDDSIRKLNKRFRSKDAVTNVLSFPQYSAEEICKMDTITKNSNIFLGDIAMSSGQIMRESNRFNIDFFDRCSHLFVHGVLHLLGMDHIDRFDEEKMQNLEVEILGKFGIADPYILKGE